MNAPIKYPETYGELTQGELREVLNAQMEENRAHGARPWDGSADKVWKAEPLTAADKRIWFRFIHRLPEYGKDSIYPPELRRDALYMALRSKNTAAARRLLAQRKTLTWEETALYAPLALHWSAGVLTEILDRGPREEVFCRLYRPTRGGRCMLSVRGTLLTLAAGLDDLPAVELLLAQGYSPVFDFARLRRRAAAQCCREGADWHNEAFHISLSVDMHEQDQEWVKPLQITGRYHNASPLTAALLGGAVRCVRRLARAPGFFLSKTDLAVLSAPPIRHAEGFLAAREALLEELGASLEELLTPGDFYCHDFRDPLFVETLRRCPEPPRELLLDELRWSENILDVPERRQALSLVSPPLLGEVLAEALWQERRYPSGLSKYFELARALRPPLDRNAVHPMFTWEMLEPLLDVMPVTGEPPEGGLSGLAAALLTVLYKDQGLSKRRWDARKDGRAVADRILWHHQVVPALKREDPAMVRHFCDTYYSHPASAPLKSMLFTLLDIPEEEETYGL